MPRSRKNSAHTLMTSDRIPDSESPSWDIRRPEEIAGDSGEYWVRGTTSGPKGSRIPVAKVSPAPIPIDYLERDAPVSRKLSGSLLPDDDFSLTVAKSRSRSGSIPWLDDTPRAQPAKRSVTEGSPKKAATNGTRKPSIGPAKSAATGRPKTRSGSTAARPTTRSGELSPSIKAAPEGEPPWMISAYKPDPRLPPDQQLLPTVAKRLQQEKWEKEGKFGNIYDRDFRPLNDEGFRDPPPPKPQAPEAEENQDEWPLRTDSKSPPPTQNRPGTSSYSTMPRIQDKPAMGPLPSPRSPLGPPVPQPIQIIRMPTALPEEPPASEKAKSKKSGCGCCVVM
jgi:hypothetical protein